MADVIQFGATPMDPSPGSSCKPEDGVLKWVHHQTPAAMVRFNRTIHAAAQIDPPEQAKVEPPSQAQPSKPLLFIHNLKPHRKTGK